MINIVILAAGMGKRMNSDLPKVLHKLAGKPLIHHVLETARSLSPTTLCIVYGHGGEQVREQCKAPDVQLVKQEPQLGTGHAVQQALPLLDEALPTLVLYGDVPLIKLATLQDLISAAGNNKLAILTATLSAPEGYGRIVRENGKIRAIVEHKDASDEQRATLNEINTGIMVIPTQKLKQWLPTLSNNNAQSEFYLTDVIAKAAADGIEITSVQPESEIDTRGINSKPELNVAECFYQIAKAQALLESGVTLLGGGLTNVRGNLQCGRDVTIDIGCIFEGEVTLEDGVQIGAHCIIKDSHIGKNSHIKPFSYIEDSVVGMGAQIGPYARLRPGTQLAEEVHIGNFVEVKKSKIGAHSKANHLSYIGDATIGQRVNIGAGAITCNYDGVNKFQTIIEDDAFIGSDSQLIAPVTVGKGATLGAGTTLSKDAPAEQLTITRAKQTSLPGWARPVKKSN